MCVFICWSGDRSRAIAKAAGKLLQQTLNLGPKEVFISDRIEKGVAWFDSIRAELTSARAGVVCLTTENVDNVWLHFECGALGSRLAKAAQPESTGVTDSGSQRNQLFTLIHGITAAELKGPLSAYQATATTRADLGDMIAALARVLERNEVPKDEKGKLQIPENAWKEFERTLDNLAVPATKLIPELETHLAGRSFNEPMDQRQPHEMFCHYNRTIVTLERLKCYQMPIRAACPRHEQEVFELLLGEIERYTRVLEDHLLAAIRTSANKDVSVDARTQSLCEVHRLAVKSLASLLIQRQAPPMQESAVRFIASESDEERKAIVLTLEAEIRHKRDLAYEGNENLADLHKSVDELTTGKELFEFRESVWDLDRIYYYLIVRYFTLGALRWKKGEAFADDALKPLKHDWFCAARDVTMELERYRLRAKGSSLLPLKYALEALQKINRETPPDEQRARNSVKAAVDLISKELSEAELKSGPGADIDRALKALTASSLHATA